MPRASLYEYDETGAAITDRIPEEIILGSAEFECLLALVASKFASPSCAALSRTTTRLGLDIEATSIHRVTSNLENKGLVSLETTTGGTRRTQIKITQKGIRAVSAIATAYYQATREVLTLLQAAQKKGAA